MPGYKCVCLHTYIHTCTCKIQMYRHTITFFCIKTYIHIYIHKHMILVFPDICSSGISIFLFIRKYRNVEISEIQKSRELKSCMFVGRHVCMYVCMYGDGFGVEPLLNHHYPIKDQKAYTIINVCICEYNSEGDRDGCTDSYRVDPIQATTTPLRANRPIPS